MNTYREDRFDRVGDEDVRAQLDPMLTRDDRPSAARLRTEAWSAVGPLVRLNECEREFVDRLHQGEMCAKLIAPRDEVLADRIRRHPRLQWKVQNVREQGTRSRGRRKGRKDGAGTQT